MADRFNWRGELSLAKGVQVLVEPLVEGDLEAIYAIERRAHAHPWKYRHFVDSLKAAHHHCLGVREGDQWIAYAVVSCVGGEAELLLLVVDTRWQGRGVGQQLIQHVASRLSGHADTLFLEVRAGNARAIDLYEQQEFNQVGVRPGYYPLASGREDALIFARTLD